MKKPDSIQHIELRKIVPDPNQPRQEFDNVLLDRLARSIKQQGILVPLALEEIEGTDTYLLVDGERRYRASLMLGLKIVPAIVYPAMDAKQRIMTRFHLQEQHSNWSAFDKAKAIAVLQQENNLTDKEIADLLELNTKTVQDYLLLLQLSKRSIHMANEHKLPYSQLATIVRTLKLVEDIGDRQGLEAALIKRIKDKTITKESELNTLRIAIKQGDKSIVRKIIEDETLTPKKALEAAGVAETIETKRLMTHLSWTAGWIRRSIAQGYNKELTTADEGVLLNLKDAVEEYLTTGGVAVPYKRK